MQGHTALRCMYDTTDDQNAELTAHVVSTTSPIAEAATSGGAAAAGAAEAATPTTPAGPVCNRTVAESDITEALEDDAEGLQRYRRFKAQADNPDTRTCPYQGCGHSQLGTAAHPAMRCERCNKEYCFYHENAHVGKSCAQYVRDGMFVRRSPTRTSARPAAGAARSLAVTRLNVQVRAHSHAMHVRACTRVCVCVCVRASACRTRSKQRRQRLLTRSAAPSVTSGSPKSRTCHCTRCRRAWSMPVQ
ncbi:hypothetical protein EON67_07040 [archaeon]|nr:MAG: hypothetical protein EON67_07040 [archaeon]